ncbi:MAG: mannosyltransferase family protein [Chloroflexota bacterium]
MQATPLPRLGRVSPAARVRGAWAWLWEPLLVFGAVRGALAVLVYASQLVLPSRTWGPNGPWPDLPVLDGWIRGDAGFYLEIAQGGYAHSVPDKVNTGFFPLYPLLVHVVGALTGSVPVAALLVANVAFALALVALYRLVLDKFDCPTARRAVLLLSVFPYALFYGAAYTESLFLLLAVLSFLLAERERWWLSGVAGLLCAATRLVGGALFPALLLLYLARRGWAWRRLDRQVLAPGLVPMGSLAYMAYLNLSFGDSFAFVYTSLVVWSRYNIFEQGLARLNPANFVPGNGDLLLAMHLVVALAFLAAVPAVWRALGAGYAVFVLIAIAIPLSSQVESLGRFMAVLFPVFIALAHYARRPWVGQLLVACSAILLGFLMALFANRYPIT